MDQVDFLAIPPIFWYSPFMARPLCIEYHGAVYHVTSRGNEKKPVPTAS